MKVQGMRIYLSTIVLTLLIFGLLPAPSRSPSWQMAQAAEFSARTWGGVNADRADGIAAGSAESIYITARYGETTGSEVLLQRWGNDGSLKWNRAVNVYPYDYGLGVQVAPDRGVVVVGSSSLSDTLLMKFTANGNLVWIRDWGAAWSPAWDLVIDVSGNIFVGGGTTAAGDYDVLLHKFSADGNHLYTKALDSGEDDPGGPIALDGTGNYLYMSSHNASEFPKKTFLYKVTSTGNVVWVRRWDGALYQPSHDVVVDKTGSVYLVGSSNNTGPADPRDIYVLKFDPSGNLLWARGWDSGASDDAYRASVDKAGNIYVVGWTDTLGDLGVLLLEFSPAGTLLLSQVWQGTSDAQGLDVTVAGEGNVLITGLAGNNQGSWQNIAGTVSTPDTSVAALSGNASNLIGTLFAPVTTPYVPIGVENIGGGGSDVLLLRFHVKK